MVVRLLPITEPTPSGKYACLRVSRPSERATRLSMTGMSMATVSAPLRKTLMSADTIRTAATISFSLVPTKR